jgi:beta-N-acetylhexosaminidase
MKKLAFFTILILGNSSNSMDPSRAIPIHSVPSRLRKNTGQPRLTPLSTSTPPFSRISGPLPSSNKALLGLLTLDQKIAQLMMIPVVVDEEMNRTFMANSPYYKMDQTHVESIIQEYGIGSVIILGKGTPEKAKSYIDRLQGLAQSPLLVGIDAEYGLSMRLENTLSFPRAMTLGALAPKYNPLIRKLAQLIGTSCKELGIGINFAPVADVNNNPDNPIIGTRSFGEDPERVACKATLLAQGLTDAGIIACAKHFPGHGDTTTDSHCTLPIISHDRSHLNKIELRPFRELIKQRIPALMTAHLLLPALDETMPASASPEITTNLLKYELGFTGLIITDGLGMGALLKRFKPGEIECNALLAGNDILLGVMNVPLTIYLVKQAIKNGKITEDELDQRVLKVLEAKDWINNHKSSVQINIVPTDLKREIYRNAITLVKNNQDTLPHNHDTPLDVRIYGLSPSFKFTDTLQKHVHKTQERASTVVLAIYPVTKNHMIDEEAAQQQSNAPISLATEIMQLSKDYTKIIAVLFDSPYRIVEVKTSDAIICAYEDDPDAQESAAFELLGFLNPNGVLPVSVGKDFPVGTGLSYPTVNARE